MIETDFVDKTAFTHISSYAPDTSQSIYHRAS